MAGSPESEKAPSPSGGQLGNGRQEKSDADAAAPSLEPPSSTAEGEVSMESISAAASDAPWLYDPAVHLDDEGMVDLIYDEMLAPDPHLAHDIDPAFASWPSPGAGAGTGPAYLALDLDTASSTTTHADSSITLSSYHNKQHESDTSPRGPPCNLAEVVRRASELGNVINELHTKYSCGQYYHPRENMQEAFPVEFSGEVLQLTSDFLDMLRCLCLGDRGAASADSRRNSSAGSAGPGMMTGTATALISHSRRDPFPPPPSPLRVHTDKPAALQLIASYQRLLDLHLLFYKAVYEYLSKTEGHAHHGLLHNTNGKPPIWQDLMLGGASLGHGQFADLHVKLVLQVMARVLEGVEGALGLSGACRVSSRPVTEGGGVLGSIVSPHFVEMCMAEEGSGAMQGSGAIARIREVKGYLARMLDAPGA